MPLDDQLQDDAANEAIEDALGGVGDFDDIHSLKGILSEALGDTLFKVALVVVVTFNFAYTFYNAFGEKHSDENFILETQCDCEPSDRRFYSTITIGTVVLWVIFLLIYGGFKIIRTCCKWDDDRGVSRLVDAATKGLKKHKRYFKKELVKLVASTYYMDDENQKKKMEILKQKTKSGHYPIYLDHLYPTCYLDTNKLKDKPNKVGSPIKRKCTCAILIKVILVIIRFVVQISIVPLLVFQWLNHYAWSCVMDSLRHYCTRLTEEYHHHIGIDQSITIYGVYVSILLSVLFTIRIKWLPKGFPQFNVVECIPHGYQQLEPMVEADVQSIDGLCDPTIHDNKVLETNL